MRKKALGLLFMLFFFSQVQAQTEWTDLPLSEDTFYETETAYKQSTYDIAVAATAALEFKIAMQDGDFAAYSWTVEMADPSLLDVEFHGHTEPVDGKGDVMFYKIHNDGKGSGVIKAPFDGIHGWFLHNRSADDVVMKLTVSGFYTDIE